VVPARNWFAYLPRIPPFMDTKSYSGRRSFATFRLAFLIEYSFVARSLPSADESNQPILADEFPSGTGCCIHRATLRGERA